MDDMQALSRFHSCVELLQKSSRDPLYHSSKTSEELLHEFLREAANILCCEDASIWILNKEKQTLSCMYSLDGAHKIIGNYCLEVGFGIIGTCAFEKQPLMIDRAQLSKRHCGHVDEIMKKRTREMICSPIVLQGQIIGVLCVLNKVDHAAGKLTAVDQILGQLLAHISTDYLDQAISSRRKSGVSTSSEKSASLSKSLQEQPSVVATSPQMQEIMDTVRDSGIRPLLLTGETGVGKDIIAGWAHRISPQSSGRFISINLASIQESLWESELFGYAKGAFTGATKDKPGMIEQAANGTLFLNEIGEMSPPLQAKLLSFLDTGEYQRVGDVRIRKIKTRIIAATNRELNRGEDKKNFRRDLYYRLASVHVIIPPLRERPDDIIALTGLHLARLSGELNQNRPLLIPSMREILLNAEWPGNTRELFSVLESAYQKCNASADNILQPSHLPSDFLSVETETDSQSNQEELDASLETNLLNRLVELLQGAPSQPSQPVVKLIDNSEVNLPNLILKQPQLLRGILDEHLFAHSGEWNLSAAYRFLKESGKIDIGRRAFSSQIRNLFSESGE